MENSPWISKDNSGIEYYYHPFLDTHSIYTPFRKSSIFIEKHSGDALPKYKFPKAEVACSFCMGKIYEATPDKSIAVKTNQNNIVYFDYPTPQEAQEYDVLFRKQSNLFEILNYEYWQNKHNLQTPQHIKDHIFSLFQDEKSKQHLEALLALKYSKLNIDIFNKSLEQKMLDCEAFFAGYHDLITSGRHYCRDAENTSQLFHSGKMTYQEHFISYNMIIQSMNNMIKENPYISFIAIFQNWLSMAGASFEHWHKQILGTDFWSHILGREASLSKINPKIYSEFICNIAHQEHLFIAENEHALAYLETGGKTGRIVICSKSKNVRPNEHSLEELQSMSNLVHAIFTTLPTHTPYNEEWFYTPYHQNEFFTPWRIVINLRTMTNAGFENIMQTLITPISLSELAKILRNRLENNQHIIANNIHINPKHICSNSFFYWNQ